MKEIMAIIRMDMINKTKQALLNEGFASMTCCKVLGRGCKKVDFSLVESIVAGNEISSPTLAEAISEGHRLIPKRLLTMLVDDDDVQRIVDCIISINSKGRPGDGKIFVMPMVDIVRVRTGESGTEGL